MNEKKDTACVTQTRRAFCGRAAVLAMFGGVLGPIVEGCATPTAPSNAAALPIVTGSRTSAGVTVPIDASSPLAAVGSAALVQSTSGDFLVARTAASTFVAMSAICTHQTCVITGFSGQTFVCPCHGSTFDTSGQVTGGPARASLVQYSTQFADGVLTIA